MQRDLQTIGIHTPLAHMLSFAGLTPDKLQKGKGPYMKKAKSSAEDPEMRTDYGRADFAKLTRGKFHKQVTEASNVIILDSKVAKEFPNSFAVNKALKAIISKRH